MKTAEEIKQKLRIESYRLNGLIDDTTRKELLHEIKILRWVLKE